MVDERDWSRTGGHAWADAESGESVAWDCGYCGAAVTSERGWHAGLPGGSTKIRICPRCNAPTFFSFEGETYPQPRS